MTETAARQGQGMTILHLSDLHFGRIDPHAVGLLAEHIAADHPDVIVISGDLSQAGRRHEFQEAAAFLQTLAAPVLVVPGNHDVPARNLWGRFTSPYRRYRIAIADELMPCLDIDGVRLVGVNSARPVVRHWNWAHGRVSTRQLVELDRLFAQPGGEAARVLVIHHPPIPPAESTVKSRVENIGRLLDRLPAWRIDVVLSGHLHEAFHHVHDIASQQGERRSVSFVGAGTALSTRLRRSGRGANRIRIGPDGIDVAHVSLGEMG
ncbi:MAG: metallophosphoesterase [Alphaproteobacteria bacterium]|jgi:3',5'-cyclic AMP phosphodiesterase CpdA|nr:metallophosphoesterase [Alphaproteobacteria bacterium]